MNDTAVKKLALSNFWVAFIAFILACFMGEYQVLERSGLFPPLESAQVYFASVSTHGVLMAYVLTTFFIMGFGYYTAATSLKRPIWNIKLAWIGFAVTLFGVVWKKTITSSNNSDRYFAIFIDLDAKIIFSKFLAEMQAC